MARDVLAPRNPDAFSRPHRGEDPVERADTPRPTNDSQMQSDGHHLGRMRAFAIERVEGVQNVVRKIDWASETVGVQELHVVRVEGVGQHDMWAIRLAHDRWKVVVVAVAIIEKAAVLHQKPTRVGRCSGPGVPPDGALSCRERNRLDSAGDTISLLALAHDGMAFPSPAVGGDFVAT